MEKCFFAILVDIICAASYIYKDKPSVQNKKQTEKNMRKFTVLKMTHISYTSKTYSLCP